VLLLGNQKMEINKRREQLVQQVREIAQDLSGVSLDNMAEDATFLELGFDSLFLTQLSAACQKKFGVRITFRQLFSDFKTISALGAHLDEKLPAERVVIASAPKEKQTVPVETAPIPPVAPVQPVTPVSVPLPAPILVHPAFDNAAPLQPLVLDQESLPIAGMESVLLRQLELMSAQLAFLQGLPADSAIRLPQTQSAAMPTVAQQLAPTSIPVLVASSVEAVKDVAQVDAKLPEKSKAEGAPKIAAGFGPGSVSSSGLQPLPPSQQQHLDRLIENYTRRTAGSKERTQRYRSRLADPRTAAGFNRRWKDMVYPIWVQRSSGSKLWDVDGNEYIDLLNGFGPNFIGHAPAFLTKAIGEQLARGLEIGPQTPLVGEVAEMICQLTGMDRASFTCSGSEAVQAAMRLSRTFTGRDKVVVFSRDYHGNFDQVLVRQANRDGQLRTMPSAPGIPFQSVDDTYVMEYGTDETLDLIKKHAGEIAAVLVEPVQSRRPDFQPKEFLHELRRITRETGIVLVFDEVVTGFRCAPGGAQAHFGVEADLATYGKVLAGGMPIGVVAGCSSVMDIFDGGVWQYGDDSFPETGVTFFAGTFVRHPLSIAAAHATLKYLIQEGPALQQRVSDKAARFAGRINELFKKYEVNIELPRFTSQMYLRNNEHAELANLFGFHLRHRGVHLVEGFPCYMIDAHSEQDFEHLVQAFTDSVEEMVEDGIFGNRSKLSREGGTETKLYGVTATSTNDAEPQITTLARTRIAEYPPTDLQREMWIAAQMRPEASAASNGTNVVELDGDLNVAAMQRAIAEVVKRHEALRSTFNEDGTKVVVRPPMPIELRSHDLSSLSSSDAAAELTEILERDGRQVFDLAEGPLASFLLIRMATNKHLLVFTAHMIICDGWGFKVALEEISTLYSAFVEGRQPSLELPSQMREYASWQVRERGSVGSKESEEFWLSQFRTLPPPFDLPNAGPRTRVRSYEAARANLRIKPDLYADIKRAARQMGNTPFALVLTGFATWLYRLSGMSDFAIGVPFAGQGELGLNTLVGQCVHTLPFRVQVERGASFVDQLARTQTLILDAQEHWNSNLGTLVQKLNAPSDPGRIPLAPVIFNLDPALSGVQFSGCTSRITSGPRFYFHYDLGFNVIDEGETLLVECDYNSNLFDGDTIRFWLGGFQTLLQSAISNANQQLSQLPMLNEADRPKLPKASPRVHPGRSDGDSKSVANEYVAPRNENEERLARLWRATLNLDRVSSQANFFELGGQSLSAVSLFAKIEQEFGKKLPLATLFRSPTIEALAIALQGEEDRKSWSPLVAINPNGSKPPLFLVHGAGGNVLLFRALAEQLAPDFPLYGLQSKGLDGESQPLRTIEEMAACYVRELRSVQPQGPYFLGGYCLGGTIAYEMAQILRHEGEDVPLVAMLDTYNFSLALKVSFRSFLVQKAKFHLANMFHLRPADMIGYLREKMRLGFGGELTNLKTSMPGASREDGVSRATSGPEEAVQAINDYAAEHYEPLPYAGRVTLFKPRFNYKFYPDPRMGWGDLVLGGLDIVEVAVNPHSMLLEPYVKVLAAQLKERVENGPPSASVLEADDSSLMENISA
jgi:glutamate-1-semialdehyde aminotransferase/thioesterase domain-containing protein/acyl carrier protein